MNNLAPNKWMIFMQWTIALQWLQLAVHTFSTSFINATPNLEKITGGSSSSMGYTNFLQENILNNPELFSAVIHYGGIAIGIILLLSGLWVMVHKPIGLKTITGVIIALIGGILLNLFIYFSLEPGSPALRDINILMSVLQLILMLYYLQFRRYKKRNNGTNLQY